MNDEYTFTDPEIAQGVERARAQAEAHARFADSIGVLRGKAALPGDEMSVEVDSSGALTSLKISDRATARGGARLSRDLRALVTRATSDLHEQILAEASKSLGENDSILTMLESEITDHQRD